MEMNRCGWCDGLVRTAKRGICRRRCGSVVAREQEGLGEWSESEEDEDES